MLGIFGKHHKSNNGRKSTTTSSRRGGGGEVGSVHHSDTQGDGDDNDNEERKKENLDDTHDNDSLQDCHDKDKSCTTATTAAQIAPEEAAVVPLSSSSPFDFEEKNTNTNTTGTASNAASTGYMYPTLYEEADEMLQASVLIYSLTELRTLAKKDAANKRQQGTLLRDGTDQTILTMPLRLRTCLDILHKNYDVMQACLGETEHSNTMKSLHIIHERSIHRNPHQEQQQQHASSSYFFAKEIVARTTTTIMDDDNNAGSIELIPEDTTATTSVYYDEPTLLVYGDDNPGSDLVYAIGVDPSRQRVTVAFRGSVTTSDFRKDSLIFLNHQPNPMLATNGAAASSSSSPSSATIGIHQGFYDYLLRPRKSKQQQQSVVNDDDRRPTQPITTNKYEEIMEHLRSIFAQLHERQHHYKLYCTGHSLGGALATVFSLYAAAELATTTTTSNRTTTTKTRPRFVARGVIPGPVTCISIASPRVGDRNFQRVYTTLEAQTRVRHLRLVNTRDPIPMFPTATSKKVWSALSPVSYCAFKYFDRHFEDNETFYHTGIKLRLAPHRWELSYGGIPICNNDTNDTNKEENNIIKLQEEDTNNGVERLSKLVIENSVDDDNSLGSERSGGSSSTNKKSRRSFRFRRLSSSKSRNTSNSKLKDSSGGFSEILPTTKIEGAATKITTEPAAVVIAADMFQQSQLPDVIDHMGTAYIDNLGSIRSELSQLRLNDLYKMNVHQIHIEKTRQEVQENQTKTK